MTLVHGWTDDGLERYVPGINCCDCGRFVGRDGSIEIEYFEMSTEVASVDGMCARCLAAVCSTCEGAGTYVFTDDAGGPDRTDACEACGGSGRCATSGRL